MPINCTIEGNVLGHSWEQIPSTQKPPFGEYMWFRCTRGCGWSRWDIVSSIDGKLLSRRMVAPSGWQRREKRTMAEQRLVLLQHNKKAKR